MLRKFICFLSRLFSQREVDQKNVEDVLFDMFSNEKTGLLPMGKFLAALRTTGIRRTDPRINELMDNLKKVHKTNNYESGSPETQNLNRETFKGFEQNLIVKVTRS